ncbi:MAG: TetR/AcrR family transcriptional regulator [bacterium]|nr:TetR/AcrR family transcriptional regulator [bacterium]
MTPAQRVRRQAILRAAEQLFAEGRFDAVLMEDVARQAGVGKGTLYRYFQDKESLYFAVIFAGFGALQEQMSREGAEVDSVGRLEKTVRALVHFFGRNRFMFRQMGRDAGASSNRREFCRQWQHHRSALLETIAGAAQSFDTDSPRSATSTHRCADPARHDPRLHALR